MTSTPTKLRLALEDAKEKLRDSIHLKTPSKNQITKPKQQQVAKHKAKSKLNTLLGTSEVERQNLSLFQKVGVPQRPTYDLIAERVLGGSIPEHTTFLDEKSSYADHVAERLKKLRNSRLTTEDDNQSVGDEQAFVGLEGDGRPVWAHILDRNRGRSSNTLSDELHPVEEDNPHHAINVLDIQGDWPKRIPWSDRRTFRQWFVSDENLRATQACESVVDDPANHLNPLVIVSESHAGCSHLLHATAQALLRRQEGPVLGLSAADAVALEGLEPEWQDALAGSTALVVDDVHEFGQDAEWSHQLGILLNHALNLGVQVVVGGRTHPDSLPPSRLKEVLRQASSVLLTTPSVATLMAYGTWRCAQRNLLLNDVHLARLARLEPSGWRAMEGRLEQVSIALDSGEVLLNHDDVSALVNGASNFSSSARVDLENQRVDDLAATLVGEAIDQVYSTVEPGGIELRSELEPWSEDEYEPPEWDSEEFLSKGDQIVDQRVNKIMESITPSRPSVLDVNERDRHLITRNEAIAHRDAERAVDILVDLDENIDARLNYSTRQSVDASLELNRLEEKMVLLAQRAANADIDTLIGIVDELQVLEEQLVELDPEREPLPPLEPDDKGAKRRKIGRVKSSQPDSVEALDDYVPDGEWNIDGTGISAEDLLDDTTSKPYTLVHLGRIRPKEILVGEEE
ncbi:MAG TPA: DnaA/Hda family protein [Poseidonia sp.]|nr:DnaA/Hda family protein [Poseidonia sp.]